MPLKLNVGISKKVGLPGYSSLGASCHVEVELDQSLVFDDPEGFQERVKKAYNACSRAVTNELTLQRQVRTTLVDNDEAGPATSSNDQHDGYRASQKQMDYLTQMAGQIRGLGSRKLDHLAEHMFGKPLADLSNLNASSLIAVLKEIKQGKIDLATALNGATA